MGVVYDQFHCPGGPEEWHRLWPTISGSSRKEKQGYLPESLVVGSMMLSIALDEKLDTRGLVLDRDDCGSGSEIHDIPCGLALSLFAY